MQSAGSAGRGPGVVLQPELGRVDMCTSLFADIEAHWIHLFDVTSPSPMVEHWPLLGPSWLPIDYFRLHSHFIGDSIRE